MMTLRMLSPSQFGSNQDTHQNPEVVLVAEVGKGCSTCPGGPEGKKATITVDETSKAERSSQDGRLASFERLLLPHLDAAYNLARWLVHNDHNAEDLVQEAYLRAFKSFDGFRGGNGRAWLLTIVRNSCYTWMQKNRSNELSAVFDEEIHSVPSNASSPEAMLLESVDKRLLKEALEELPLEFREVLIMRELEGMSYKEIAGAAGVPPGTVMSRLARARKRLQQCLTDGVKREPDSIPTIRRS